MTFIDIGISYSLTCSVTSLGNFSKIMSGQILTCHRHCHDAGMDEFSEITLHTLTRDSRRTVALKPTLNRRSSHNALHNRVSIVNESCLPPDRFEQTNDVMTSDVDIAYF